MPEFSDIFIAKNPEDAVNYNVLEQNYPHIALNDFTDYELSALWASLTNSRVKEIHDLEFIEIDSDAILYRLPEPFFKALATLEDADLISAAAIWAEHDEIHWRLPHAQQKLEEIRTLAKQAQQENKELYLMLV